MGQDVYAEELLEYRVSALHTAIGLTLLMFIYPIALLLIGWLQEGRFRRAILYPLMYFLWPCFLVALGYVPILLLRLVGISFEFPNDRSGMYLSLVVFVLLCPLLFFHYCTKRFDTRFLLIPLVLLIFGIWFQRIFFPIERDCPWPLLEKRW